MVRRSVKHRAARVAGTAAVAKRWKENRVSEEVDEENSDGEILKDLDGLGQMKFEMMKERAEMYEKSFRNEVKKTKRTKHSLQKTKEKLEIKRAEKKEQQRASAKHDCNTEKEIGKLRKKLEVLDNRISVFCADKENLASNIHCLDKRVTRAGAQQEKAVLKAVEKEKKNRNTFHVKEKGIVADSVQDLARDLVALGLKPGIVGPAVTRILSAAEVEVDGVISCTMARCAVVEGGVAADLQITEAMKTSDGSTL
ncbi:hypothetical protein BDP27DRAFT_1371046 [Rhodocollybia butyracea]|uniref:Uncharacterized protein n=1 Tax=Rhodocollybia butyracea TaxID=206335 RepID=A0A9P5TZ12_9AGAR|nr:hypothetical protein BDP27DRAFT_1371046 [Rhodocollybia butyracea]